MKVVSFRDPPPKCVLFVKTFKFMFTIHHLPRLVGQRPFLSLGYKPHVLCPSLKGE